MLPIRVSIAFFIFLSGLYVCFAPGRILFPDDEIVFQTTEAIYERGELSIPGIDKRTGEPKGRPDGTFGWAPGTDTKRYGFFGHALSVVALPAYALGDALAALAPDAWHHVVRSDHYIYHRRSKHADWTRLCVSLVNCVITPVAAWLLAWWLVLLGIGRTAALTTAVAYALGTAAFPYAGTFLSEPLSAAILLASAGFIARAHACDDPATNDLPLAGLLAGLSVHVHILNLIAIPCLLGYALWPLWRRGDLGRHKDALVRALAVGATAIFLLALDHHWRFGSPFETGRYDHYGYTIFPGLSLLALVLAPGRGFFFYAPAAAVGLVGLGRTRRRLPVAFWFVVALLATRTLFVATRSDWFGGWGIGPRYLVPAMAFAMLPLAVWLDEAGTRARRLTLLALGVCALAMTYLATYSIFEHMFALASAGKVDGVGYFMRSHWWPSASPYAGFWQLRSVDILPLGAVRLARVGHHGPAIVLSVVAAASAGAAVYLLRWLASGNDSRHVADHGSGPRR